MDIKLLDFPQLRQSFEYNCGSKALQGALIYYGIEVREESIMKEANTCHVVGTLIRGIENTLKKYQLQYDSRVMTIEDIEKYLDKKTPILMLLQAWGDDNPNYDNYFEDGHWVVAIGYDKNNIYFEDPYAFKRTFLTKEELLQRWHAKQEDKIIKNHAIAIYGKEPAYNSYEIIHMD
jgi:ABC-type bacteriocin/lantibiotic exporter with double-glycine peptidase domain